MKFLFILFINVYIQFPKCNDKLLEFYGFSGLSVAIDYS